MNTVTVSSKGQIAIPKAIREALDLSEGTKLTVKVEGHKLILARNPSWRDLEGSVKATDLVRAYASFKKKERQREDSRT
jgi:AbrB family looped-hinge helix DNA binding protein